MQLQVLPDIVGDGYSISLLCAFIIDFITVTPAVTYFHIVSIK